MLIHGVQFGLKQKTLYLYKEKTVQQKALIMVKDHREEYEMIADFMGYEYIPWNDPRCYHDGKSVNGVAGWWMKGTPNIVRLHNVKGHNFGRKLCRTSKEMNWHSWGWMMKVVKKIHEKTLQTWKDAQQHQLSNIRQELAYHVGKANQEESYQLMVKYIKHARINGEWI